MKCTLLTEIAAGRKSHDATSLISLKTRIKCREPLNIEMT